MPFHVIINPESTLLREEWGDFYEGRLSLSGFSAVVSRASRIRIACLDEKGGPRSIEATGWRPGYSSTKLIICTEHST